jgi:hypothetical protein
MQIDNPGGNGERTEAVWMYLVQHGPDDEGLAAVQMHGKWFPLIATTDDGLKSISALAQEAATESGLPIMLARFDNRIDIGKVLP